MKGSDEFPIIRKTVQDPRHQQLLLKKGIYPYEYIDSFERFNETRVPPKNDFYSSLTGGGITDEDYAHAQDIWDAFGRRTLCDYHDLYVATDSLLLADVFENFRKVYYITLLQRARFELGRAAEEDRSRIGVADRHGHAPVHREGSEGRRFDGKQTVQKGKQPSS